MQFPNELIALVIQHVDNACTLHAMLSVSKDVFIMAAPALYRRPLWPELSESSGYKLIDWLLTLSVAEDKNTDLLRHIRNIGPQTREGTRPSIDYLSLISAFQWVNISWWGCLAGWTKETSGARQLVFGMYTAMAARLRNLSTIYIHFDPHQPFHAVCDDAVLMIEAIQEQHGANLLRACYVRFYQRIRQRPVFHARMDLLSS
ncbi:hypothetical protein DFQ27_003036 [Actinomortierella ambigua]|uniref:Uncharacterized protein n=1 Tax=Actinomortierella ambigua TaxID=1343610 RepID=A0A9P6QJK1_9FUNG|nr:hypothetical protein DFQ27_003036 [Actinomortierella ambigua]